MPEGEPENRVVLVSVLVSVPAAGEGDFTFDELVAEVVGEVEHGIQSTRFPYAHLTAQVIDQ